jgi:hypothetical protein
MPIELQITGGTSRTDEEIEDLFGNAIKAATGSPISVSYDDTAGTVEIDSSGASDEQIEDAVAGFLSGVNGITVTQDDANDTIKVDLDQSVISHDSIDQSTVSSDDHHPRYTNEEVRDVIGAALNGGANISLAINDSGDSITINTSALNQEEVEDVVDGLLSPGTGITLSYSDAGGSLTVALDQSVISHDSIDQSSVSEGDHHNYPLQGSDIDLSDIAGENITVDATNNELDASGGADPGQIPKVQFEPGMSEWGSTLNNAEVYRMDLLSGEVFELERLAIPLRGGGTDGNLVIDVYDVAAGVVIDSTTAGTTSTAGGTSNSGGAIIVRITNNSSNTIEAGPIVRGHIQ